MIQTISLILMVDNARDMCRLLWKTVLRTPLKILIMLQSHVDRSVAVSVLPDGNEHKNSIVTTQNLNGNINVGCSLYNSMQK